MYICHLYIVKTKKSSNISYNSLGFTQKTSLHNYIIVHEHPQLIHLQQVKEKTLLERDHLR